MKKPLTIVCAGECMMELHRQPDQRQQQFAATFAGDVINFSIYLKRLLPSSSVHFFSAVGEDAISRSMLSFIDGEAIDTELVFRSATKTIGLYMIDTDAAGERSFSYWRSDSAAKKMFELADNTALSATLEKADYFYFSGITLAILDQHSRERLFAVAEQCRDQGKTVIFDPNFRATLWQNRDQALTQIQRAYQLCNTLLTSNEDEQRLWGQSTTDNTLRRLADCDIDEIILTDGADNIAAYHRGNYCQVKPVSAASVVDTTSAGDAFNAGYIAARHAGYGIEDSIEKASGLASLVIGLPGAIIPKASMSPL